MGHGYIVVEGEGEEEAVGNLINRLWNDLGLSYIPWAHPIRGQTLHTSKEIKKKIGQVRARGDASCLLIIRDADVKTNQHQDCPKVVAPSIASLIVAEQLPFPTAIVLLYREYETLFLPCLSLMAGRPLKDTKGTVRPGLNPGTSCDKPYESIRGVKEWLSDRMPSGRAYKPKLDQLALTRLLDFTVLRQSGLPCFGTLERALQFLASPPPGPGQVYPSASG